MTPPLELVGSIFLHAVAALLCAAGILLGMLSLSGTWLVVLAAGLEAFWQEGFPGWKTVAAFALIALTIEGAEALSGFWGVTKRGGSAWAGFGALLGSMLGMSAGTAAVPLLGTLIGAIFGSFIGAYLVELLRLRQSSPAARVARGAAAARVLMTGLKVGAALGMSAWLFAGILVT